MKNACCNKQLNTPFCPQCGTKSDSPHSLVIMLENELSLALQQELRIERRLDIHSDKFAENRVKTNTSKLDRCKGKILRIEGWLKWIAAVLDNTPPKE